MKKLTFRQPDNWHAHLREMVLLALIANGFNVYGRVMCMGNLKKLIETANQALDYKQRILEQGVSFKPVMCIMLTQDTTPEIIREAGRRGIKFVKFIPVGTSHGASKGLRLDDYNALFPLFEVIAEAGMHLLVHAELISYGGKEIHLLYREERAIGVVAVYHCEFPNMKITIEHVSTAKMINLIKTINSLNFRGSLALQHALFTYLDVFSDQDKLEHPLKYCLPVAKLESDRLAVIQAMISGSELFFYGTDAAAHWLSNKLSKKPNPGVFFGEYEIPGTLEIFKRAGAMDKFEDFTSRFGAEYYGFPLNKGTITVVEKEWIQPIGFGGVNYCMGGQSLGFQIVEVNGRITMN